jgi:hypothetical protein
MNGIDIEKYLKDLRIPYILKNIIKLLILLLLILWASTLITKLILSSTIEPRLIEINNVLIKKEKTIELYEENLNECYKRHGEKGCIRIEEKLLDLKADYNNYLIDCNQKLKELDTYRYRGKCEDMTKLYKKEK